MTYPFKAEAEISCIAIPYRLGSYEGNKWERSGRIEFTYLNSSLCFKRADFRLQTHLPVTSWRGVDCCRKYRSILWEFLQDCMALNAEMGNAGSPGAVEPPTSSVAIIAKPAENSSPVIPGQLHLSLLLALSERPMFQNKTL